MIRKKYLLLPIFFAYLISGCYNYESLTISKGQLLKKRISKDKYKIRVEPFLDGDLYPILSYLEAPCCEGFFLQLRSNKKMKSKLFGRFEVYDKKDSLMLFILDPWQSVFEKLPRGIIAIAPYSFGTGSTYVQRLLVKKPKKVYKIKLVFNTGEEIVIYHKGDAVARKKNYEDNSRFNFDYRVEREKLPLQL